MFENIDELIEVNIKLLYTSKSQYMMRINFKDEFGFNLKNSKLFADILVKKGIVELESNQGFRCDLTELGKQIYEKGGWNMYMQTIKPFPKYDSIDTMDSEVIKTKKILLRIAVASIIILVLCFFMTMITVEILLK